MDINIELIKASFEKARPIADKVIETFYSYLFRTYPEVQPYFHQVDMEKQQDLLLNNLAFIVDNLEYSDLIESHLFELGQRHAGYGASEAFYEGVGQCLIRSFSFYFGKDWTPELENEWVKAYTLISSLMLKGEEEIYPVEIDK